MNESASPAEIAFLREMATLCTAEIASGWSAYGWSVEEWERRAKQATALANRLEGETLRGVAPILRVETIKKALVAWHWELMQSANQRVSRILDENEWDEGARFILDAILAAAPPDGEDTVLLDWMEAQSATVCPDMTMDDDDEIGWRVSAYDLSATGEGRTLRDAIRAARLAQEPATPEKDHA